MPLEASLAGTRAVTSHCNTRVRARTPLVHTHLHDCFCISTGSVAKAGDALPRAWVAHSQLEYRATCHADICTSPSEQGEETPGRSSNRAVTRRLPTEQNNVMCLVEDFASPVQPFRTECSQLPHHFDYGFDDILTRCTSRSILIHFSPPLFKINLLRRL